MAEGLWWRQTWMKAIYASDLKPLERLVAAVYAEWARDKRQTFVTLDKLTAMSGLSRDAANRARDGLEKKGWLVALDRKPRKPIDFLLVIPEHAASTGGGPASTPDGLVTSTRPDTTSTPPDTASTGDVLHQSSYQTSHQSLSPEQTFVRDLLGLDDGDERLMKISKILQDKNVHSPKPWLRKCHANGELLDLLQAESTASTAWGTETKWCDVCGFGGGSHALTCRHQDDDSMMPNPGYVDGWGTPERIKVEDYYKGRIVGLGYTDEQATAYLQQATEIYPTGSEKKCWHEAYMTALNDTACHDCGQQAGKHSHSCDAYAQTA